MINSSSLDQERDWAELHGELSIGDSTALLQLIKWENVPHIEEIFSFINAAD